tara:strand:+ start:685 stop:897 length:213 start_codon:yes stop_codon:yes gene_type:complete
MILHGNERGGAKNLSLHLLKEENDHVTVHELRGFMSGSLVPALNNERGLVSMMQPISSLRITRFQTITGA